MQQLRDLDPRLVIILSILLSPMVYLESVVAVDALLPPPLIGIVFIFGSLRWYPSLNIRNPFGTRHEEEFLILFMVWVLIGLYLVLNYPKRTGVALTLLGHLVALAIQCILPFFLFTDYTITGIIPLPITPIVSIITVMMYLRNPG